MDNRAERAKMLGEGHIPSVLTKLAIPGIIAMLISAVYNAVDTIFVGMLNNTSAIGAVTVAFPLFMFITAIGQMLGIGGGSFISRLLGENDKELADKVATTNLYTSYVLGILLGIVVIIFLKPILILFGATDTILPFAKDYALILAVGAVFTVSNMAMNNMIRAEGNAKYSMIAISIGAILNIVLDPIFMFTFGMGVKGAALATVVGQMISNIYLVTYYISGKSYIKVTPKNFSPSFKIYGEILKIGSASLLRQGLSSISLGMMNSAARPYGDAAVAAIGVALRVFMIFSYIVFGYFQGFQPVAGYNYGAKKYDRLTEAMKVSFKRVTAFCIISTIVLMVFTRGLISVFTSDTEVINIGVKLLRAISLSYPLFGFQQLYAFLFQSMGKGKEAMLLSVARQGLFLIPAVLIMPRILGLNGVIYCQTVADLFTILVTGILAVKISKELKAEQKQFQDISI